MGILLKKTVAIPEPTGRQMMIFRFVWETARDAGYQPSIREIGEKFGIRSPNGCMVHLRALAKKGYLAQQNPALARAVMFLKNPDGTPFIGFEQKV